MGRRRRDVYITYQQTPPNTPTTKRCSSKKVKSGGCDLDRASFAQAATHIMQLFTHFQEGVCLFLAVAAFSCSQSQVKRREREDRATNAPSTSRLTQQFTRGRAIELLRDASRLWLAAEMRPAALLVVVNRIVGFADASDARPSAFRQSLRQVSAVDEHRQLRCSDGRRRCGRPED